MEVVVREIWVHQRVDVPGYVRIAAPNTRSVYRLEGSGITTRDENGFRKGYTLGVPKVLILGDSYTEALQVNDDEVFSFVAQQMLSENGVRLGLVNAGVAGRSSADYVAFAPRNLDLVKPIWTVVVLRADDLAADAHDPGKTHFARDADGKVTTVVHEPRSASGLKDKVWNSPSILVRYVFYRLNEFAKESAKEPPLFQGGQGEPAPAWLSYSLTVSVEEALEQMRIAYDGRLTIVNLPYVELMPARIVEFDATRRLFEYCARTGLSCVEPTEEFLALGRAYKAPYGFTNSTFNFGHMNADGHKAVATVLARELQRLRDNGLL
jgi:hypothetical protein